MNAGLPPASLTRPTRVRWMIFGLACAVSWLLYLHRYAWGVIRPSLKEENPNLTDIELGWLDSVFNVTYAIGQVPGGMAGDLLGARAVLPLMVLSWSACVAGIALVSGFGALAAVRVLFGLSQAGAYPVLSKVTRNWFAPSVRTTVQGMVASLSGRAGGACASIIVASFLMAGMGLAWREALQVLALLGLGLALAFWMFFRNGPREHPWVNQNETNLIEAGGTLAAVGAPVRIKLGGRRTWTLGALLLYSSLSTFADQLFVFWIPQFLAETTSLSLSGRGYFASLPLLGGALGGAAGGVLNDVLIRKTGNRRLARSVVGLTGKGVGGVLLALSVGTGDGRIAMSVLLAAKFFGDWSLSTQWGTITDIAGRASGTVFGIVNMAGTAAGFLAGPVLGNVKYHLGWDALFYTAAGVWILAALCWLVIDCTCQLDAGEATPASP